MSAPKPQPPTSPTSRRALLAGAAAGVGAVVVKAVTDPLPVRAAGDDDANVQIGHLYDDVQSQTTLGNAANNNKVLWVASNGDLGNGAGVAITGFSQKSTGVEGWSSISRGVYGHSTSGSGVHGQSGSGKGVEGESATDVGVRGIGPWAGVYGTSVSQGVRGDSQDGTAMIGTTWSGTAVWGDAETGTGVFARSFSGFALTVDGRIQAGKVSGLATIPKGATGVTVLVPANVTANSFVLLTPKANIGSRSLWFTTNPSENTIRIRLSSARNAATPVSWLMLN